jgi:hypothetical protein
MSISYYDKLLVSTLTIDSNITRQGLDLAIPKDDLPRRASRTVTFTLSSSTSSSSSLCSQQDNQQHKPISIASFNTQISENRVLKHSQSLTLECQRRRPAIEDPYQLKPNLQILNDWMIVSLFFLLDA